ncbi:MAG: HAD hydrolase-like protein [Jatrophihabitantaceae bacterium]
MPAARVILFDLDGTVSDSARGILAALRHAFAVTGLPPMDARTELAVLGPPFYESLPPLIGDVPLDAVVDAYRDRYAQSMFDTSVFPGVLDVLDALRERGVRLAIATSKPEYYAVPIVERLGLSCHFETVGGDERDGSRPSKALVIAHVLSRLGDVDPADVLMVGDRSHDVLGARAHGIDCVAVGWGYALPGELEAAAPAQLCPTPADLARYLELDCGVDDAAAS